MGKYLLIIAALAVFTSKSLVEGIALKSRRFSSCGYMGGKIYCYGGVTSVVQSDTVENTLYSLNIDQFYGQSTEAISSKWEIVEPSAPFDTELRRIPNAIVLSDGKRLLIQGGYSDNTKFVNQTIVYDITTNTWKSALPYTEGNRGIRQIYAGSAVNLPNNLVGFYGGYEVLADTTIPRITASGANMSYWPAKGTSVGYIGMQMYSPEAAGWASFTPQTGLPVDYYPDQQTATLDPVSGLVYYLGGMYYTPTQDEILVPFNWALTFNTKTGAWGNETLSGQILPSKRTSHTAHLMPNSRDIIIYGGTDGKNVQTSKASVDYCFTLNLVDKKWTEQSNINIPSISSGPRYAHSSVLVNTTLFILYGKGLDGTLQPSLLAIDVANVANISYSTNFGPVVNNGTSGTNNNNNNQKSPSSGLSKAAVGGIAAGAAVAVLAVAAAIVYCLRKRKTEKSEANDIQNNQNNGNTEQIDVDWDKLDDHYREVSPISWGREASRASWITPNSPHSANSVDATTRGSFSPEIASTLYTADVSVVKPSIDITERDYDLAKPNAV